MKEELICDTCKKKCKDIVVNRVQFLNIIKKEYYCQECWNEIKKQESKINL